MGFNINNFVYPCHGYTDNAKYFASQHYCSARGRHGTDTSNRFELAGIMIDDHTKLDEYKRIMDNNNKWVIFYCHLCTSKIINSTLEQRLATVDALLSHCKNTPNIISTVNEALNDA
jgi:hypothetical protein